VEEGKHEDERFILLLGAFIKNFLGELGVSDSHVCLKTIWGLGDDL
jgi:hypothetical protein